MSASNPELLKTQVKALTFDVFGTVVDWRSSVVDELVSLAASKAKETPTPHTAPATPEQTRALGALATLSRDDWGRFAQQWRNSYKLFTRSFVPGETPWKDIDTHHYDSLVELLREWRLEAAFPDGREVRHLSLVWHRLRPWEDSAAGLKALGGRYVTSTLSNGNTALLRDLDSFGGLGFREITSAEEFKAYKPNRKVYLGAVEKLRAGAGAGTGTGTGTGAPGEVAMVAAHLDDLAGAREAGLRTVYVERPQEEGWEKDDERYQAARGWVDVWVGEGEGGFVEVARRLGLV